MSTAPEPLLMDCDICRCRFRADPGASVEMQAWSELCEDCAAAEQPMTAGDKLELGEHLRLAPDEVEELLREGTVTYFRLLCPPCRDRMTPVFVDEPSPF